MVSAFGNDRELAQVATSIWGDKARVVHPMGSITSSGVKQVLEHQAIFNSVLQNVTFTDYSVQHDSNNVRKPRVQWSFNATLGAILPSEMSSSTLSKVWHLVAGKSLTFKGNSFITFEDNKIQEDIRTVDSLHLMTQLQKSIADPFEMSQVLQVLASLQA